MRKLISIIFITFALIENSAAQPRVWNSDELTKAKLANSPQIHEIERMANQFLKKKIFSVVDKKKPAPSGDMHDYISSAPYWWPDPLNPSGPYIRRDGEKNKDVLTPDKVNLSTMTKSVVFLSLAYFFTEKEEYAIKAVDNLRIWFLNPATRMNPNLNFGQTITGHNGGKGRGAGLIDTYQFVTLIDALELLNQSTAFTHTDQDQMKAWFDSYLTWMLTSPIGEQEYQTKNNHGTAFDVQATRIALYVGRNDVASKFIDEFTSRRIFKQITPEGKQPEELVRTKALHYSMFNLTHMIDMCMIARTMQRDLFHHQSADGRSITAAFRFLTQFVGKPQSSFPYQQIAEWDVTMQRLSVQLFRADRLAGSTDFKPFYVSNMNSTDFLMNSLYN